MSDRLLTSELAGTRPTPKYDGRCVYCGARCYGRACSVHKDLLLAEQATQRGTQ